MAADTVLGIIAQGAWNGGTRVDNSIYENEGMSFKGGIPVNHKTIASVYVAGDGCARLRLHEGCAHFDHRPKWGNVDTLTRSHGCFAHANKMVTHIHERGNCSVVCMQRLLYDLECGALQPDKIQGYAINQILENSQHAKTILYDSIGRE